ncbi:MAG: hypothetical protein V2I27_08135 [Erythrobacter sp.]|nr:hypothetical protein [Erythrobacter sp.]
MPFLDRIAAAITPPASDEQRADARAVLLAMAQALVSRRYIEEFEHSCGAAR